MNTGTALSALAIAISGCSLWLSLSADEPIPAPQPSRYEEVAFPSGTMQRVTLHVVLREPGPHVIGAANDARRAVGLAVDNAIARRGGLAAICASDPAALSAATEAFHTVDSLVPGHAVDYWLGFNCPDGWWKEPAN